MIPNINTSAFTINPGVGKKRIQSSDEINKIRLKLKSGVKVDDLSKEEYSKLNNFEKAESASFFKEVMDEMNRAEAIAMKIAKGKELTEEEKQFISAKYPDMKREAEQAKKEGEDLANRLKCCKTKEERQMLVSTAIGNISNMAKKGALSEFQVRIKIEAIEEAVKKVEKDKDKGDNINIGNAEINAGTFIDKLL